MNLCDSTIQSTESGSEQENAEFLTGALVRVNEVKGFRVSVSHDVFEVGAHVHEFLGAGAGAETGGNDTGADGDALHGAEDRFNVVAGAAAGGETGFAAVTEGGPEWDRAEGTGSEIVGGGGTALECDADEAVAHFTDEVVRG